MFQHSAQQWTVVNGPNYNLTYTTGNSLYSTKITCSEVYMTCSIIKAFTIPCKKTRPSIIQHWHLLTSQVMMPHASIWAGRHTWRFKDLYSAECVESSENASLLTSFITQRNHLESFLSLCGINSPKCITLIIHSVLVKRFFFLSCWFLMLSFLINIMCVSSWRSLSSFYIFIYKAVKRRTIVLVRSLHLCLCTVYTLLKYIANMGQYNGWAFTPGVCI